MSDDATRLLEEALGVEYDGALHQVMVTFEAEDLRALLQRCALFVASGKHAPPALMNVRLEVSKGWAFGIAADGYTLAVQKMRCMAEGEGSMHLAPYDIARILSVLPKPNPDIPLGPVTLTFMAGGDVGDDHTVSVMFSLAGRVSTYSFQSQVTPFPNVWGLVAFDRERVESPSRTAVDPDFLDRIAKAALVAKDQQAYIVRLQLRDESGRIVAHWRQAHHSEFVAILMPMTVTWEDEHRLPEVAKRLRDRTVPAAPAREATMPLDGDAA